MSFLVLLALLGWVYLACFNGEFWNSVVAKTSKEPDVWPSVDIIVPARNEADSLPQSLPSLLMQDYPGQWRIILVDDHSTDSTGALALQIAQKIGRAERLKVVSALDLPSGWVGKVAAMQAGVSESTSDCILFTDADIEHPSHSLRELAARALAGKLDLVSRMVKLHCETKAEMLLIPAFVFFFAMLYPFRKANDPKSKVAAAAGGVMFLRRRALDNAGGLAVIKSALIDDCSLAKIIKNSGGDNGASGRIELALSKDIKSLRVYPHVMDVWKMVARTAFTQVNYSNQLLAGTVLGMVVLYFVPIAAAMMTNHSIAIAGSLMILIMALLYIPMITFYQLPAIWVLTLPAAALIYIGATIDSARLHWMGRGGQWKGRVAESKRRF